MKTLKLKDNILETCSFVFGAPLFLCTFYFMASWRSSHLVNFGENLFLEMKVVGNYTPGHGTVVDYLAKGMFSKPNPTISRIIIYKKENAII